MTNKVWKNYDPNKVSREVVARMNGVHPAYTECKYCQFKKECPKAHEFGYCRDFRLSK